MSNTASADGWPERSGVPTWAIHHPFVAGGTIMVIALAGQFMAGGTPSLNTSTWTFSGPAASTTGILGMVIQYEAIVAALVFASGMLKHSVALCERCMADMPLNPERAVCSSPAPAGTSRRRWTTGGFASAFA